VAPQLGRYLLPVLALLAVLAGAGWQALRRQCSRLVARALTVLLVATMAWAWQGGLQRNTFVRLAAGWDRYPVEEYMRRYVSYWPALEFINHELPDDARVLLVAEARSLYFERDVVIEDSFRTPYLTQLAARSTSAQEMALRLRQEGITHLLYNHHEAARIAVARGRPDYFGRATPEARLLLRELFAEHLQPLMSDGQVEVFAVRGPGS
jgi:hypothetical protein